MKKTLPRVSASPAPPADAPAPRLSTPARAVLGFGVLLVLLTVTVARPGHSTGGPVPVLVTGTASVSDTDNGARQPFGKRVFPSASTPATFTVPAGKRLVFTDLAAFNNGTTATDVVLSTTVNGVGTARPIPFNVTVHGITFAAASLTDYADPGSTVTVFIDDTNSSDFAGFNVDIHGYYVNVP